MHGTKKKRQLFAEQKKTHKVRESLKKKCVELVFIQWNVFFSPSLEKEPMSNGFGCDKIYFCASLKLDVFWSHWKSKVEKRQWQYDGIRKICPIASLFYAYVRGEWNFTTPTEKEWKKKSKNVECDILKMLVVAITNDSISAWLLSIKAKLDLNCEWRE